MTTSTALRHELLRNYLIAVLRDILTKGKVRMTDSVDKIFQEVLTEFTQDVSRDIKSILSEIKREGAKAGIRLAESYIGNLLRDLRDKI